MTQAIALLAVGLASGAIYAGVGLGVTTTYKGTGVVNLAQAAFGIWGAFAFDAARRDGSIVIPIPGVPNFSLGGPLNTPVAMLIALSMVAALAAAVYWLVFRPLRQSPLLARLVASLGLLLVFHALITSRFGVEGRQVAAILPNDLIDVAGVRFPQDRLLIGASAVAVGLVLWAIFRFTSIGLAIRASAEDETVVALGGWSPDVLGTAAWSLGAMVTAVPTILASPAVGLSASGMALLIVPGLAAAMVGRLTSVPATVLGGLALGAVQSELSWFSTKDWWPEFFSSGFAQVLPFIVIATVLFFLGSRLPVRGEARATRLPRVPRQPLRATSVVLSVVTGLGLLLGTSGGVRFGVITSMIIMLLALSLVLITGYAGQLSLAHAAIAGSGGFVVAKIGSALPFPIPLLIGALAAAAIGSVVALPALRIRGAHFAIISLSGAIAIEAFVFRNPAWTSQSGNPVPAPVLLGLDLSVRRGADVARLGFGLLVLVLLTGAAIAVANLARGRLGRAFLAVRSDERAAAAAGINVARVKMIAFAASSFLAGTAGGLIGYSRGQLSAESFALFVGVMILATTYIGGITTITGALLAGLIAPLGLSFILFQRYLGDLVPVGEIYALLAGVGLIVQTIRFPDGLAAELLKRLDKRRSSQDDDGSHLRPEEQLRKTNRIPAVGGPRLAPARGTVLSVRGLTVRYGGLLAVDALSFDLRAGEVVGLIGPNGAGKTSVIDALAGFAASTGTIELATHDLTHLDPHERQGQGLSRTWQTAQLFDELTVLEHLTVAAESAGWADLAREVVRPVTINAEFTSLLRDLGIGHLADRRPDVLTVGEQRLVDLARALATRPAVLLADEPAAGLDGQESSAVADRLRALASAGTAVLVVEHDLELVGDLCDRLLVLDFGRLLAAGNAADVLSDAAVVTAYMGELPKRSDARGTPGVPNTSTTPS